MFTLILTVLLGVAAGYLLRNVRTLQHVHSTITLTICFMLFVLGLSVGQNSEIISHLVYYGGQALLICMASIGGSVIAAWLLHRYIFKGVGEEVEK